MLGYLKVALLIFLLKIWAKLPTKYKHFVTSLRLENVPGIVGASTILLFQLSVKGVLFWFLDENQIRTRRAWSRMRIRKLAEEQMHSTITE